MDTFSTGKARKVNLPEPLHREDSDDRPRTRGSVGWDQESINTCYRGVFKVPKYDIFLENSVDLSTQIQATEFEQHVAPAGGFVNFTPNLGDSLESGDRIFTIMDVFGTENSTVTADGDGILWRTRRLPQVATGYICSRGTSIDHL